MNITPNSFDVLLLAISANYVNPSKNKLENATIVIYDIHGKTLINKPLANWSSHQVTVDIQQFITGVYTLVLKDGKHQFSKRFIKN
ncbi:MAG: T9SS type A sorting domain-containing protein [Bacteroidota bacterium]